MSEYLCQETLARLGRRFALLYGAERARRCVSRAAMLHGRYDTAYPESDAPAEWTQKDAILIAYPDMLKNPGEKPLHSLRIFLENRLQGAFDIVHLLPFFPSSSDDGFSVVNYRQVAPEYGSWADIRALGSQHKLMFDLVLNHTSRQSNWVKDYTTGTAPARDYFLESDPNADYSAVIRPRTTPLLTKISTINGERHLWATFSEDQIDFDYANPDVLFEFLDLALLYFSMGARILRMDAIAFLWKKIGTPCLHLPETHEIVKIFRDFLAMTSREIKILTETNVPHNENISYFGQGDEAHMVYQFALPPLLLHAMLTGDATHMTGWAEKLGPPPPGCAFLNFTASHDGIGVRPLQGLAPDDAADMLVEHAKNCGGTASMKRNPDGSESPYELNVTYYDAMGPDNAGDPGIKTARFLCSQNIAMQLQGIPAVYFNSLVAAPNNIRGVETTGRARTINRQKWDIQELEPLLDRPDSAAGAVFKEYSRLLRLRSQQPAFSPDAGQAVLRLDKRCFALERFCPKTGQRILCLNNVGGAALKIGIPSEIAKKETAAAPRDLLDDNREIDLNKPVELPPCATRWIELKSP